MGHGVLRRDMVVRRSREGVRGDLLHNVVYRNWEVGAPNGLSRDDEAAHPCQVHHGNRSREPTLAVVLEDVQGACREGFHGEVVCHDEGAFHDEVEGICRLEEEDVESEAFLDECDCPLAGLCNSCPDGGMVALGSEVSAAWENEAS